MNVDTKRAEPEKLHNALGRYYVIGKNTFAKKHFTKVKLFLFLFFS